MPRGSTLLNTESAKDEISPIVLVRILDMPETEDPETTHSLYLTDCDFDPATGSRTDIDWYDENGAEQVYTSCGVKYEQVEISIDNTIDTARLTLDNVSRTFSALAQYVKLNGVEVQVYRGYRELLAYADGAQLLFLGHIKKAIINEHMIQCDIWTDFSLKTRVPRRLYSVDLFPYIPAAKDIRETYTG